MKCPNCGCKELMWDFQRGDVICTNCGLVLDKILVLGSNTSNQVNEVLNNNSKGQSKPVRLSRITIEYLKLLRKTKSMRGNVKVRIRSVEDIESSRIRQVKIFYREFNKDKLRDNRVVKIMRIMDKYPRLKSRTDRAKLAIALIALHLITKANRLSYTSIQNDTGLSRVHIRRLINEVKKERNFIEEVKAVLMSRSK